MTPSIKTGAAMLALIGLLAVTSGCSAAQANTVLSYIESVVQLAGSLISVSQGFGLLNSPQEKQDVASGLLLAQEYSAAASEGVKEFNSADPWNIKVDKITAMFTSVAPIPGIQTAQINAAVVLMTGAVKLLLMQLGHASAPQGILAQAQVDPSEISELSTNRAASYIPGTISHRLKMVQQNADRNVVRAGHLHAALSIR